MNNVIRVDDMKLVLLPPEDYKEPTKEEVETETLKLITVFAGIKQRVLRENKNHCQYVHAVHLQKVLT